MPGPARPKVNLPNVLPKNTSNFSKPSTFFRPSNIAKYYTSSLAERQLQDLSSSIRQGDLPSVKTTLAKFPENFDFSNAIAEAQSEKQTKIAEFLINKQSEIAEKTSLKVAELIKEQQLIAINRPDSERMQDPDIEAALQGSAGSTRRMF